MTLNRTRGTGTGDAGMPGDWGEEPKGRADAGRGGCLGLLLILAGVLAVFVFLAVRTAGFRELAAERIAQSFGIRVRMGGSAIGWPGELVFRDVTGPVDPAGGLPPLHIREARAGWRPGGVRIVFKEPVLRLAAGVEVVPESLAAFAVIGSDEDVARLLAPMKRRLIRVEEGRLEVEGEDGAVVRRVENVRLEATRLDIPGREAVYFSLRSGPVRGPGGLQEGWAREWLWVEGVGCLVIAGGVGGDGYWKGTGP